MILYAICMVEREEEEEEKEEGRAGPLSTLEGLQALKMYLSSMGRSEAFQNFSNQTLKSFLGFPSGTISVPT